MDNWSVWCYICDDNVQYSSTGHLAQLVTNIKKQALSDSNFNTPQRKIKVHNIPAEQSKELQLEEIKLDDKKQKEMKTEEETESKNNAKKESALKRQKPVANGSISTFSVKGFSNLGNTCFFNAVIQNLAQTQLLRQTLSRLTHEKTSLSISLDGSLHPEPLLVHVDPPGSLTLAMCQLLKEIQESKKGVVTPRELFTQVCKKAARFKGYQQQDSQELLRYLLDGIRAEEIKRLSSGILEALKHSGKNMDAEQSKALIKEFEKNGAHKNIVDQVFGGELTSTVMCQECKTVSLVTEMFLDLSLPVSDEVYRKKNEKKSAQKGRGLNHGDCDSPIVANGDEESAAVVGSKYQQKKAKKQAKKQAKNQRRQQKSEGKVTLDALINHDAAEPTNSDQTEESEDGTGNRTHGEAPTGTIKTPQMDDFDQEHEKPSRVQQSSALKHLQEGEEGAEEERESCVVSNRFTTLLEDQENGNDQMSEDKLYEEEKEAVLLANGEHELADNLGNLSLNTAFVCSGDTELNLNGVDEPVEAKEYTVVNQDPELAFQTLAWRATPERQACSVQSSLFQFTEVESLTQKNCLLCVTCTKRQHSRNASAGSLKSVYRDAVKQMLISSPPPVLTLHLKRFQQIAYSMCKVNRHVQFPNILDLAPFCSVNCKNVREGETQVLYSLYGIVEHSGTMRSGHYTAYVKARPLNMPQNGMTPGGDAELMKGSWFHISDTSVQLVSEAKVQSSQAYLLFYERIS